LTFPILPKSFSEEILITSCNIRNICKPVSTTLTDLGRWRWPANGGWNFPIAPELSAASHPAIWQACEAPSVIILVAGGGSEDARQDWLTGDLTVMCDAKTKQGRHLVLQSEHMRHRLLIPSASMGDGPCYPVKADRWLETRTAAMLALHRSVKSGGPGAMASVLVPSDYHRFRLMLLLRILDRLSPSVPSRVTTKQVAQDIVYPGTEIGRTIDWKYSSQRRQTQRLIKEALEMMMSGYRLLLKGKEPG
jgi:hypothetical protein